MATCDQILQLFSPYSKLHMIIVIDSSSEKNQQLNLTQKFQ